MNTRAKRGKAVNSPNRNHLPWYWIVTILVIFSCQKSESPIEEGPALLPILDIEQARLAFENASEGKPVSQTGISLLPDTLLGRRVPQWERAFVEQRAIGSVVFVPIELPVKLYIKGAESAGTYLNENIYLRMVDRGNGFQQSDMAMLSLFPDRDWVKGDAFTGAALIENWFEPNVKSYWKDPTGNSPSIKKMAGDGVGCHQEFAYQVCAGEGADERCTDHYRRVCDGTGDPGEGDDPTIPWEGETPPGEESDDPNGPSGGSGNSSLQVNRTLKYCNFNFQPSFGRNWQAAAIREITIAFYPASGSVKFHLSIGVPTFSDALNRTISREEAQKAAAQAYETAIKSVNADYVLGLVSKTSIGSRVAARMQIELDTILGFTAIGKYVSRVSNNLESNPGAPTRYADFNLNCP